MKTSRLLFLLITLSIVTGCAGWKKSLSSKGDLDEAVHNAIVDFAHTSKLFQRDSVFNVYIKDREGYYKGRKDYYKDREDYYFVQIGEIVNKIYTDSDSKDIIGTYKRSIPNKYVIYQGKLFYWVDPKTLISKEIVNVLLRYEQIELNWEDRYPGLMPDWATNDAWEAVDYFICKNDISNYKKKKTDRIDKIYRVPKLKCK